MILSALRSAYIISALRRSGTTLFLACSTEYLHYQAKVAKQTEERTNEQTEKNPSNSYIYLLLHEVPHRLEQSIGKREQIDVELASVSVVLHVNLGRLVIADHLHDRQHILLAQLLKAGAEPLEVDRTFNGHLGLLRLGLGLEAVASALLGLRSGCWLRHRSAFGKLGHKLLFVGGELDVDVLEARGGAEVQLVVYALISPTVGNAECQPHFKLSPAFFDQLEGGFSQNALGIREGFVQLVGHAVKHGCRVELTVLADEVDGDAPLAHREDPVDLLLVLEHGLAGTNPHLALDLLNHGPCPDDARWLSAPPHLTSRH